MPNDTHTYALPSYWYLASPYSSFPGGMRNAAREAESAAAQLIAAGVPVYSPIAHSHSIAATGNLDPEDYEIWMPLNRVMMRAARGLIVLTLYGWATSRGVRMEIEAMASKRQVFMRPGIIPAEVFQ